MSTATGLPAVCEGAAARLREICRELDPRSLPWVSTAGDELARRLDLERALIRRAADDLDGVRAFLGLVEVRR